MVDAKLPYSATLTALLKHEIKNKNGICLKKS